MFTSGEVVVEKHGVPEVTGPLVEALRLQLAYGHPFTPKVLLAKTRDLVVKHGSVVTVGPVSSVAFLPGMRVRTPP